MTNKAKIILANVFLIFGFLCVASGSVMLIVASKEVFGIISMLVSGVIFIVIGGILWKHSNHSYVEQHNDNTKNKPKKHKNKKTKAPFMTEKEWKEQEEEDDEMMFIEEVVEDDYE